MSEKKPVRCLFNSPQAKYFNYCPLNSGHCKDKDATLAVKFAKRRVILDDWYLIGGTRWSRFVFRLKHPNVY